MTAQAKRYVKWSIVGNAAAMIALLVTQGGFVLPWHAVSKDELNSHTTSVERRLDELSNNVSLIMGALGVKEVRHDR